MGLKLLVTGGTGHLGRALVEQAVRAGHALRILSRQVAPTVGSAETVQGDLASGDGIAAAVAGIDVVVHAASDPFNTAAADVEGMERLTEAARAAGVGHFVFVSIVGIDRIPLPYYRHKLAAEEALLRSGVPWSIQRAAQFHYFVDMFLRQVARVPLVLPVPRGFHVQSIGVGDVAQRLLAVATAPPAGRVPDLFGPEVLSLNDAASRWLLARRMRRVIAPIPLPGKTAAAFRQGYNTSAASAAGVETWDDWLARAYGQT